MPRAGTLDPRLAILAVVRPRVAGARTADMLVAVRAPPGRLAERAVPAALAVRVLAVPAVVRADVLVRTERVAMPAFRAAGFLTAGFLAAGFRAAGF